MYEVCALTGHRDLPENFSVNELYDTLEDLIRGGCRRFRCGMAQGFDLAALSCLTDLRQKYVFTIEACIPYAGHIRSFPQNERERYRLLLSWCEEKTVVCPAYTRGCYLARDRYMVDGADVLVAFCTKQSGGTAYTVRYARGQGVPVVFVGARGADGGGLFS